MDQPQDFVPSRISRNIWHRGTAPTTEARALTGPTARTSTLVEDPYVASHLASSDLIFEIVSPPSRTAQLTTAHNEASIASPLEFVVHNSDLYVHPEPLQCSDDRIEVRRGIPLKAQEREDADLGSDTQHLLN